MNRTDSTTAHRQQRASLQMAVLLGASAEGVLALMDAVAKGLATHTPIIELAFLRFVAGSIVAALVFVAQSPRMPSPDAIRTNTIRSLFSVGASLTFFFGLSKLPLAEAMALTFAAPLFIAALGVLWLKERFTPRIGLALLAGIVGMLVIVGGQLGGRPYAADAWLGALSILGSAVFFAFNIVLLRARANRDPFPTIVLIQNIVPALCLALPTALIWQTPASTDGWLFAVLGCLGVTGHTLFAHAFSRAEAAKLAAIHYLALPWGTLYGWLFFSDLPGATTLIGATIVAAGTWLTRRH